ncbi:MAG TPA: cytochrome P450 [Opitutaceae bacterium]|nr:cytochrome P450 [Opitutaceae bacterium]
MSSVRDYAAEIVAHPDNPYPIYEALREAGRVYYSPTWKCSVLSHYQDVAGVLFDPARFSSRGRVTNVIQREFPESFLEQIKPLFHHYSRGVINLDPPDHTRMRRLVQKAFLPRTLERLVPEIHAIVRELLDAAAGRGAVDLVADLAYPLPVSVIAEMLGVPREDRGKLKRWSGIIMEFQAVPLPTPESILRSQGAIVEMRDYLRHIVRQRRADPRDDVISALATAEMEGDRLAEDELLSTCLTLLVAGHETTTNLIASATWLLLRHRDQLERLRANPAAMGTAIEEVLRFESPLHRVGRTALVDTTVAGAEIRKGETVFLLLASANRDPAQFRNANTFDIQRTPNKHIAFGHGIHFCLGAALARLEAPIALNAIFDRWPNAGLTDEPLRWHSGVMRGLERLPLQQTER